MQALKAMGVRLVGVNYKDDPANVAEFLADARAIPMRRSAWTPMAASASTGA